MPKMKTNRAAAKRFRKTAFGKFKCGHAFKSHILTKKSTKRKRGLRATNHVRAEDAGRVARMMPYALGGSTHGTSQAWCHRPSSAQENHFEGEGLLQRPPQGL